MNRPNCASCPGKLKYVVSHGYEYIRNSRLCLKVKQLMRICRIHTLNLRKLPNQALLLPDFLRFILLYVYTSFKMLSKLEIATGLASLLGNALLLISLGMGLYTRWNYTDNNAILFIGFTGLFVFSISIVLIYYFSKQAVGNSLSRLYIGCMLGVVAFTEHSMRHDEMHERTTDFLLMASLFVRCINKFVIRLAYMSSKEITLVDGYDSLEMLGMATAAVATGEDFISITLLLVAVFFTITSIRLKSLVGVVNLLFIIVISKRFYFPKLELNPNPFALGCFIGRMAFEPLVDLYFCTLTTLDRWHPLFAQSSLVRRVIILIVFTIQMTFYGISAKQIRHHKEWFIVVPMFIAFSAVWLCYHLVFLVTCWLLSNKITQCMTTYTDLAEKSRSLHRIMASKGVRHFSLISQRLVLVTVASSIILGLLGWTMKTPLSLSLLCMVVPLETAVMSLLWEMGSELGGTCIGYALVAPALTVR